MMRLNPEFGTLFSARFCPHLGKFRYNGTDAGDIGDTHFER
jgi:hypothetical protein